MTKKYQIWFDEDITLARKREFGPQSVNKGFYLIDINDIDSPFLGGQTIFTKNELKEYLEYKKQDQVSRKEVRSFIRTFGVEV